MADPKKPVPASEPDRKQMMRVLIPAVAIALVVVVAAIVASQMGGGRKMADGSDGTVDDPNLKEITAGVKMRDIKEGTGEPCLPGSKVTVNYTGWLIDGTVFDTNKNKRPVEFSLDGVVQGWTLGIPGMKPGGIRKLVISPEKGYGNRIQPNIPPGSTLIFEVELIEAQPPRNVLTGPGRAMSDDSNGGTEDSGLKDIGDGLKMRDLKEGSGDPVNPGAEVTIHYTGWTADGKVFDSSRRTGKPTTFGLAGLIPGWQKGIPGMKPGGIRKLVIPAALGYGTQGSGADIPPNATLIFEVELVK